MIHELSAQGFASPPLIQIQRVTRQFGNKTALDGVTLRIEPETNSAVHRLLTGWELILPP